MWQGLPSTGGDAVKGILGDWRPLRQDPARQQEEIIEWGDLGEPLPPITIAQLDEVLKTYPQHAGLGVDDLHPRSILQLPLDFRSASWV